MANRHVFPIDVNKAPKPLLLRVPGIGVRNVERILQLRRFHKITLLDLKKMNVALSRTKYFIITKDHNPNVWLLDKEHLDQRLKPKAVQLSLFDQFQEKVSGEL